MPTLFRFCQGQTRLALTPLGFKMELHLKDLRIALAEGDRLGLPMEVTRLVAEQAQRLVDSGHGDEDSSSLARVARGEIPA